MIYCDIFNGCLTLVSKFIPKTSSHEFKKCTIIKKEKEEEEKACSMYNFVAWYNLATSSFCCGLNFNKFWWYTWWIIYNIGILKFSQNYMVYGREFWPSFQYFMSYRSVQVVLNSKITATKGRYLTWATYDHKETKFMAIFWRQLNWCSWRFDK